MWMATRKLHALYRSRCDKYHVRRPADERSFMKKLKVLCPGLRRKRRGWEMPEEADDGIGSENPADGAGPPQRRTRPWGYTIPDLPDATAEVERGLEVSTCRKRFRACLSRAKSVRSERTHSS